MLPKYHALVGLFFCAFLVLIAIQNTITTQFLAFLAVVWLTNLLIDVDHYIIFVYRTHNISLRKAYKFFYDLLKQERKKPPKNYYLCVFHTIEFVAALFFVYFLTQHWVVEALLVGVLLHIFTDLIAAVYEQRIYKNTIILFSLIARAMARTKTKKLKVKRTVSKVKS